MEGATMTKEEKISILTDDTKTDAEVAEILGYSKGYLSVLRQRMGLNKRRGNKTGTIRTSVPAECKVCGSPFMRRQKYQRQYCSRKCQFACEDFRNMLKNVDKSYMQEEYYRDSLRKEDTPEYRRYANRVHKLTKTIYEQNITLINPNNLTRTLAGVDNGYQLDHIIPVRYGFDNNIPPEEIARLENLRMIPWKENVQKGKKLLSES